MKMQQFQTPILFITYNRLETVKKTFVNIKKIKPQKLYLASDGPKADNADDARRVYEVREWLEQAIDWQCEVYKRYSDYNQGCKYGPANAIDWVFEKEEWAIILEDDIVVEDDFFYFCQDMLRYYATDTRIMTISGYKKVWDFPIDDDYFFSFFSPIWGWATWRRAWQYFDIEMKNWPQCKQENVLAKIFRYGAISALTDEFDRTFNGELDAWDYPWLLTRLSRGGLGIVPKVNLIKNIGFDKATATHTIGKPPEFQQGTLTFPLKYVDHVTRNLEYDKAYEKKFYKKKPIRDFLRPFIPKPVLQYWYKMRGL